MPTPRSSPYKSLSTARDRDSNGAVKMEDSDVMWNNIAHFIEELQANSFSSSEKELATKRLLDLVKSKKDARVAIGTHSQAIPLLVGLIRHGTKALKINAALILGSLCKEEELRIKVLLGGCIPPLLSLLRSESAESQKAAAKAIYSVSCGGVLDHVGLKIFVTEGVVPSLWDQLRQVHSKEKSVEELLTGALKNLCTNSEEFWKSTFDAGGVEVLVEIISSGSATSQSNASSLLSSLMSESEESCTKVLKAGAVPHLIKLLGRENDVTVRAEAANALCALSSKSSKAKKAIVDGGGVPALIGSVVAPSKEFMEGKPAQSLSEHAIGALANISGGMYSLIHSLGENIQTFRCESQVADIIGALAYALMSLNENSDTVGTVDSLKVEMLIIKQLKVHASQLVQERAIEALASLYGNAHLSEGLLHAGAKRLLVGLITSTVSNLQEDLIQLLKSLCNSGSDIWQCFNGREGIQLLISFLGLTTEEQQEYAVAILHILTLESKDSRWAITAAGGIPPLVQLLESGSNKAREDAALILANLCSHSEEIRVCVESAGAVTALLSLLRRDYPRGQEVAAEALRQLIRVADIAIVNQLLSLLMGNKPKSKTFVLAVLGYALTAASPEDILMKGSSCYKGLQSLIQMLDSSSEEAQANAASALADFLNARKDICGRLPRMEIMTPIIRLLGSEVESVSVQSARALAALFSSITVVKKEANVARDAIKPLVLLTKSSNISVAEMAIAALPNLLFDIQMAEQALSAGVLQSLTRVLREGTSLGKGSSATALNTLLRRLEMDELLITDLFQFGTVTALISFLESANVNDHPLSDALEALAMLARVRNEEGGGALPWAMIGESASSIEPLLKCLATGSTTAQDKSIEILSRFCRDHPLLLGDLVTETQDCLDALANRVITSASFEVRVGGSAILICATREHRVKALSTLAESGVLTDLICSLVGMLKEATQLSELHVHHSDGAQDPVSSLGETVSLWLLSIIACHNTESKIAIMEAGGLEELIKKLSRFSAKAYQIEAGESGSTWICALLLAILFQERDVIRYVASMRAIPYLVLMLRSEEATDKFFAAQTFASLACNGNRGTLLTIGNSGAAAGLISLLGCMDSNTSNMATLSEEFGLVKNPDEVVLQRLFRVEDIKTGATARKSIPALVDLLKPTVDRPGAPMLALGLLTQMAEGNDSNKLSMAEAGVLEALTRYLSLGTQDAIEEGAADLLRILFRSQDLRYHEAALGAVRQLIAVLRLGSKGARHNAAKALKCLFESENIRNSELSRHAIQPLVEMLGAGSEKEQRVAINTLISLSRSPPKAFAIADTESSTLASLYKILVSPASLKLKEDAALLCCVLFSNPRARATTLASECIRPLLELLQSSSISAKEACVRALDNLLEEDHQVELAVASGAVIMLVDLLAGTNYALIESVVSGLVKIGKDRALCKLDMVKAGVIDSVLHILPMAQDTLCSLIAELLRILTNNSSIARSQVAMRSVEPLFECLTRADLSVWGQHSCLQTLVNILEKPQGLDCMQLLTPAQAMEPLFVYLESPSQPVQQLAAELLSHLFTQEYFQRDIMAKHAVFPLVQLVGTEVPKIQERAIKALQTASISWPNAIAEAGGIMKLSKVILQTDPQPPQAVWESAALVLTNVLRFSSQYYVNAPIAVLVKLLWSGYEQTVVVSLTALIVLESDDASSAEVMAEAGAIEALLELLRSHQNEEAAARLLESLVNNIKVREMEAAKCAISPLSQYLLDPQTRMQPARLLATLALGDLFQQEWLAKSPDAVTACRALVSLLEDQPSEEMTTVAICALQNLVMHSRTNRRAVAESGGILVVQELLGVHNAEMTGQAALLVKLLFSNHTLQEYVSTELIRSLTAALEREFWATANINEEVVKAVSVLFHNFSRLRGTEAATLCIPHLICALKAGTEPAQDAALDALCLLKNSWPSIPVESGKAQAMVAAEAIPILQLLLSSGPPSFHERADDLLQYLPGSLTVTIKKGLNLKQSIGNTNAFCKLTLGNGPSRQTKVVSHSTCPEWKQEFAWAFEMPPKGQKLQIACKSKSTFGTSSLGKVTIQIDKVVMLGTISGQYKLASDGHRNGKSRMLEIEFQWSNR